MNILQLISTKGFFGAENVLFQLSLSLMKRANYCPIVCTFNNTYSPDTALFDRCIENGVKSVMLTCRSKFDLNAILKLRGIIKENNIDLVHSHGYKSNMYSLISTALLPVPLVSTCHNWIPGDKKLKIYTKLDLFILKYFSQVIAVSEDVSNTLINAGIKTSHLKVIDNGIDVEKFNPDYAGGNERELFNIPDNVIVIGTVGRISHEKSHKTLLNAFKKIKIFFPEIRLILVGDGPLKAELQEEFNDPSIIFTGQIKDVAMFYQIMDIFVLPSLTEGLPMVLLESMAAKLPVVASSVGAIPTIIKNNENGLLVKPGSDEELEKALVFMLNNKGKREEMAQRGFETVRDEFSSEKMANEYLKVYNNLVNPQIPQISQI